MPKGTIRKPHTTSQTLVINQLLEPVMYTGECNVGDCHWTSTNGQDRGRIQRFINEHKATCSG